MSPRHFVFGLAGVASLGTLGMLLGWGARLEAAAPEDLSRYADADLADERWTHLQGYNSQLESPQDWDGTVEGPKTLWYSNGVKRGEGLFRNNVKEGPWAYWHENGQKRWEGVYLAGVPDGLERAWYPNGQKQYEGSFANERRHGSFTTWYENGELWFQGEFVRGSREGRFLQWNEDGSLNLALSGIYSDNEKVSELPDVPDGARVAPR